MSAPQRQLASRNVGQVRCIGCKRWQPLFEEATGWDEDGRAVEFGPAIAVCCDRVYLVQPDGTPEVYDLAAADEQPAEDCA